MQLQEGRNTGSWIGRLARVSTSALALPALSPGQCGLVRPRNGARNATRGGRGLLSSHMKLKTGAAAGSVQTPSRLLSLIQADTKSQQSASHWQYQGSGKC